MKKVLPVRNMRSSVYQTCDDSSQCQQTLVDVACLSGPLFDCSGPANVLRAGQIDQVQLADLQHVFAINRLLIDEDGDGKHGVRSGGVGVHSGLSRLSLDASLFEDLEHFSFVTNLYLFQSLNDD